MNRLRARLVSTWHTGPHEWAVTRCEDPHCNTKRGVCCGHCPTEYRRAQRRKGQR